MKINTDLSDVAYSRGAGTAPARRASAVVTASEAGTAEGGTINPLAVHAGSERRLSQAMTIAINASALISKALVAAARLRAMAQDTIAHRNVDYREMSGNVADIRNSLSEAGMAYSAPAIATFTAPGGAALPAIRDELTAIDKAAVQLTEAGTGSVRDIDGAITSLQNKQNSVDTIAMLVGRSVDAAMGQYPGYTGAPDLQRMMHSVSGTISANPERALAAQGNINPEKVAGLFA